MKNLLKISLIFISIFINFASFAQDSNASIRKELFNRLDNGDSDLVSLNLASELFNSTIINNPSNASEYAAIAVQLANHLKDSVLIGKSKIMLGQSYFRQNNYFMATRQYFEAYLIFVKQKQYKQELANTLLLWAKVYSEQNNFDIAHSKIEKALEIFREIGDSAGVAQTFNVIGKANLYNDDDIAIENFKEALSIFSFLKDDYNIALTFNLLAKAHLDDGKPDIAIDYLLRSVYIFEKDNNFIDLADTYLVLADNFFYEEIYKNALDYYAKALKIYKEFNYKIKIAQNNLRFANVYFKMNNFENSKKYAKEVINYSLMFNDLDLQTKTYKVLKDIAKIEKNEIEFQKYSDLYEKALIAYYEDQSMKNFSSFEMNIETSQFDKEIELIKVKSDKEKLQLSQKQYNRNKFFAIIILLLTIGFLIFLFFRFRERRRTALSLEKTNEKLKQEITERKKAELDTLSSQKRYKLLFSESPVGILQFDEKLIITEVNNKFVEIFNSKNNDVIDSHINRVFDRKTVNEVANLIYSTSNKLIKTYSEIPTKNGVVYVSITIKKYKIWTNNEELAGGIIIIEDLTEQKKNERFYKQNILSKQKLLEKVPDDIILIDKDEKIIEIHFPDYPEKELKVTKLSDIFDEDTMSVFRTHLIKVESSKSMSQFSFKNKNKKFLVRIFASDDAFLILIGNFVGSFESNLKFDQKLDNENTKENYIKNIKEDIEKELLPIYQNIQRGLSFIMIKNFAEKIINLGKIHENQKIIEFGEQLLDYVTNFNVIKVNEQLENFPTFISHFLGFGIKI